MEHKYSVRDWLLKERRTTESTEVFYIKSFKGEFCVVDHYIRYDSDIFDEHETIMEILIIDNECHKFDKKPA